jgi:cytidylate kinase
MVVAIDGPAGVGKSTIAEHVASNLGFFYLNSGNFYRAITCAVLDRNIDLDDRKQLLHFVFGVDIQVDIQIDKNGSIFINGTNADDRLHSDEVDASVAAVSSVPEVRKTINTVLKNLSADIDVVAEGRDMTTVVFPDAEIKIFLDADIESRARRRYKQGSSSLSYDELKSKIAERDRYDRSKKVGRLEKSPDAVYIDTSHLTIQQVCEKVLDTIHIKCNTNKNSSKYQE